MKTVNISAAITCVITLASSGNAQCQRQKLLASDAEQSDAFGAAVALTADWAAIGAPEEDDVVGQSGAVYMFQRVGSTWMEMQKIKASDPSFGSLFGSYIAMADGVMVVGVPNDSPQGNVSAGSVYVFELVGSTWIETVKLLAGDPDGGDYFGCSVAMNESRIVIAAVGDDEHGFDAGAAYVFDRVGSLWVQQAKLMGSDTVAFDGFGTVSLAGDQALIGVFSKDGPGGSRAGVAYMFSKGQNGWTETQKLWAPDGAPEDFFGIAVGLLDDRAVIAASGDDTRADVGGAFYAFEKTEAGWMQSQKFWTDDTGPGDAGGLIAISSEHLIVTPVGDSDAGSSSGSAYDFRPSGSNWVQAGKMLALDAATSDVLGMGVAIWGDTVLVGARGGDDACTNNPNCESGSAYIFQLAPTATQYGHCPSGAPCHNFDPHGGCRNSTGQGAILAACGSGSVTTDDLELELTHCPPNKSTLLFMGGTQVYVAYGDGRRAVGGGAPGIYRYGIVQSDASGRAVRGPGLVGTSQGFHPGGRIQAGQVWNFQVWYRDLQGPCGGLTNYSNGVQVAFIP